MPPAIVHAVGATEEEPRGSADRYGGSSLRRAFLVSELSGNVFGTLEGPVIPLVDWPACATANESTSKSPSRSPWRHKRPHDWLSLVIDRDCWSHGRGHECN